MAKNNFKIYGLSSKNELNPDLFEGKRFKNKPRQALLLIAEKFYDRLDLNAEIEDIRIVGSSVDYSWNAKSDIDLHIVIDFSKISCTPEILRKMVNAEKNLFNGEYKIKMFNIEVELYVEDKADNNKSDAVYSLINNIWIKEPKKKNVTVDRTKIEQLYNIFDKKLDRIEDIPNVTQRWEEAVKLKDMIVGQRKRGLQTSKANYSVGNLVFKTLRATGRLRRLKKIIVDGASELMSLTEKKISI